MKIILNPKEGAEIADFVIDNANYFSSKEKNSFKPGDMLKIEDKIANVILERFGFLREITVQEAKAYLENKNKEIFKCDHPGCNFETHTKVALFGHRKSHEIDIDLPIIGTEYKLKEEIVDTYKQGEIEDRKAGLEGPGLEEEVVKKPVNFT